MSVSVDIQGADVVKPFIEGTAFTTVVDCGNVLANYFGFKKVPNGIFVDEDGVIRLLKEGFYVSDNEHIQAVEKLLSGEVDKVEFGRSPIDTTSDLEIELAQTKYKLGLEYSEQGKKEEAIKQLDEALALDRENFLIRKQRWYIRYPEKFSPSIDFEWQKELLEKERAEEAAQCGPDGCEIPRRN